MFSKIDFKQGHHQISLHPDSKPLTIFSTPVGLFRYRRLNFGICCAIAIFQKKVSDATRGIPCVKNISVDLYACGVDDDDHDRNLSAKVSVSCSHHAFLSPCLLRERDVTRSKKS